MVRVEVQSRAVIKIRVTEMTPIKSKTIARASAMVEDCDRFDG